MMRGRYSDTVARVDAAIATNKDLREAWHVLDGAALHAADGNADEAARMLRQAASYLDRAADRLRRTAHGLDGK